MAVYNEGVLRSSTVAGADYLVPDAISTDIIQNLPKNSAIMQRAKSIPMSSTTQKQPVLDVLPAAYWVGGDTGLKQTSTQQWKGVELVAAELATIVPVPQAYLDDAQIPIWSEVRPRLTAAIGQMLDGAALFGINKPASWTTTSIYEGAVAAGNVVAAASGVDFAQDVSNAGELLALQGFSVDGFASRPGLSWKLTGLRNTQGTPIYQPNLMDGDPASGNLYGYPVSEVDNGSWVNADADLIAGDWDMALLGVRQDISFQMFDQGVISDDSGKIIMNLMQQDSVALRVVARFAFATANPVTQLQATEAARFPFVVVSPPVVSS